MCLTQQGLYKAVHKARGLSYEYKNTVYQTLTGAKFRPPSKIKRLVDWLLMVCSELQI